MKRLAIAAVVVAATTAFAQEAVRPQACPVCRRPGGDGATTCSRDGSALVDADLVILHVALHHLDLDPSALDDFARCETALPPYRVAAPPPDFAKDRKYCPACLIEARGERCLCGRAPVAGNVLAVQTTFAYMALLESKLGGNPFTELLDEQGGVDPAKVRALADRYAKARKAVEFADAAEAPWPLGHPVIELGCDIFIADRMSLIARAEATYHEKNGRFADLETLEAAGLLRASETSTDWFEVAAHASHSKSRKRWYATAKGKSAFTAGSWYFMNQEGKLYRASRARSVDADDVDVPDGARPVDLERASYPISGLEREACAIGALRHIAAAESVRIARPDGRAGTLEELGADRLVDPATARGVKNGYLLSVAVATSRSWCGAALPAGGPGRRFTVDAAGNVFELDPAGRPAPLVLTPAFARSRKLPDIAAGYLRCGTEHLYQAEWLEGVEPLETALALDGGSVSTWNNIGKAYLEIEGSESTLERGLACFERGIALDRMIPSPSVALCHNNAALVHMKLAERLPDVAKEARMERLASAAAQLENAVRLDPRYVTAWINLGVARLRRAELMAEGPERLKLAGEAIDALDSSGVRRGEPLRAIVMLNRALAARVAGRHAQSFVALSEVTQDGDAEQRNAVIALLGDEAAMVADELAWLPGELPEDAARELASARNAKPVLQDALGLFNEVASAGTPSGRAHLERGAARIELRVLEDPARARHLYEIAIGRLPVGDTFRAQLEKERAALPR